MVFSDQGGEFTASHFKKFLSDHGVRHLFSPPQSPYTNGVCERHNGVVKYWMHRLHVDAPDSAIPDVVLEAQLVKNLTTRRAGFSAQFLAFGYEQKPVFQINLQDLTEPAPSVASWQRDRMRLRQAAQSALFDLKTRDGLRQALSKVVQATDKTPFSPGALVDYYVIPDSKTKLAGPNKPYWAGPCRVIGRGGSGTTNKSWVICRPGDGLPQDVARHRLRSHTIPNVLPLDAIDPAAAPELAPASASAKPDASPARKLSNVADAAASDDPADLPASLEFSGDDSMDKAFAGDLDTFVSNVRRRFSRLRRVLRKKKLLEDDDDYVAPPSVQPSSDKNKDAPKPSGKASGDKSQPSSDKNKDASKPSGTASGDKSTEKSGALRRSARIDPSSSSEPLRQIVDHRLSRLKTELQDQPKVSVEPVQPRPTVAQRVQQYDIGDYDRDTEHLYDQPNWGHRGPGMSFVPRGSEIIRDLLPEESSSSPSPSRKSDLVGSPSESSPQTSSLPAGSPDPSAKDQSSQQPVFEDDERSDAGTEVFDQADLVQQFDPNGVLSGGFWSAEPPQEPGLALWAQDPVLEQELLSTSSCGEDTSFRKGQSWDSSFEKYHAFLTQKAIKAAKEVPRTEALTDPLFWQAMEAEIDQLIENGTVFDVPSFGTFVYSSRWVFTYKDDGSRKARLVVRGFEEKFDPEAKDSATDSPTLNRHSLRLIAFTAASKKWKLTSWDVKTAFQQADTRNDPEASGSEQQGLWISPPKWFPGKYKVKPGSCLKIPPNKTLYGMASAPRRFYFHLRNTMLKAGFVVSRVDECVFFLKNPDTGEVDGVVGYHVDDGLLAGNRRFYSVMEDVVAKSIRFGTKKEKDFKFCGVRVRQDSSFNVTLDQEHMIDGIDDIPIARGRPDEDPLSPAEVTSMRGRLGSLLYVVGNTRPFESYAVSHLASYVTSATVFHAKMVNKVIAQAKNTKHVHIVYTAGSACDVLLTYADSNFKKEREAGSQIGMVQFVGPTPDVYGNINGVSILRWSSTRARRVCHSTLASETLAQTLGLDFHCGLRSRMEEFGFRPEGALLTDCRSLFDHIYSMISKTAEVLVPDFQELREACMPWRWALSEDFTDQWVEIWWVDTRNQLADNLTKLITPSTDYFREVLTTRKLSLSRPNTLPFLRPRPPQRALKSFWAMCNFFAVEESKF